MISLHKHTIEGLKRRIVGRDGASFDLIHELLWFEYRELFSFRNAAVELVVLEVILSFPVLLD